MSAAAGSKDKSILCWDLRQVPPRPGLRPLPCVRLLHSQVPVRQGLG